MSNLLNENLLNQSVFNQEGTSSSVTTPSIALTLLIDGSDATSRLITTPDRLNVTQGQEGSTGTIVLNYSDHATLPSVGSRFTLILASGQEIVLEAQTVSEVTERYARNDSGFWIHAFSLVDPITASSTKKLPTRAPFLNTNTGAILSYIFSQLDPTLVLSLTAGNNVEAFDLKDFSTLGDVLKSEIMAGGYAVRMQNGLSLVGDFSENFLANSDWQISQVDSRYTPTRFKITPTASLIDSVTVSPSREIPISRSGVFIEFDPRVQNSIPLPNNIFDLNNGEILKITAGQDISDPTLWSGSADMSGSHIGLTGTLVMLEARPFVTPYKVAWTGIITDGGTTYQFGFQDDSSGWVWSVSNTDYPLTRSSGDDQYLYEIYTNPTGSNSFEVWGFELHQRFNIDIDEIISTIASVDYCTNTIVLDTPWDNNCKFIRFLNRGAAPTIECLDLGDVVGLAKITHRSEDHLTLTVDILPQGVKRRQLVTRGLDAEEIETITLISTITVGSNQKYGFPAISGSGVHLKAMVIQKTGMIDGYLTYESSPGLDQTYPRGLKIDIDETELSDAVISGSAGSAVITLAEKFSTEKCVGMVVNYMNGGKHDFQSNCAVVGPEGGHVTISTDEQDPIKLQAIADELCILVSRNSPRVNSNMHSTEINGNPLPYDPLPLDLSSDYRVGVPSVPIISSNFSYKGSRVGGSSPIEDVLLYEIDAGDKSAEERAQEESIRGDVIGKFPLRVASINGTRIANVLWDDTTLSAEIVGGGVVYGPYGQFLDLAGGIDPAAEAGITDKESNPVKLLCTVDGGNYQRDTLQFTVIYPPAFIDPEAVSCRYFPKRNIVTFNWPRIRGASAVEVQRIFTATGLIEDICVSDDVVSIDSCAFSEDVTYYWKTVDFQSALGHGAFELPYEPASRAIRFRGIGLCDKKAEWTEACCILPPLAPPSPFEVVRVKPGGIIIFRVAPPPGGCDEGRVKFLRILVKRLGVGDPAPIVRADFSSDDPLVAVFDVPIGSETSVWRCRVPFEDTDADDVVWVAATWGDIFGFEGNMSTPFDATNPVVTVGSITTADFWQYPVPGPANGLSNLALGGTIVDDNDQTAEAEFSGKFRIHLGQNNIQIKLKMAESQATDDYSVGDFTDSAVAHSPLIDVTDEDLNNGYVDIDMKQYFRWTKKLHRTYVPTKISFHGPKIRERGQNDDESTREMAYLVGYSDGIPPPIVHYQTDGVFDQNLFYFHPGIAGLDNTFDTVAQGQIIPLDNGFKYTWPRIDSPSVDRYALLIGTSPFGTKGPGQDINIAIALNTLEDTATITVYEPTNIIRSISVEVLDQGDDGRHRFHNGDIIGSITITEGVTYYVSVLAQTKTGRWSTNFSTVLNTTSGDPVRIGDPGPPGPVLNLNLRWKEAVGYKIGFDRPTTNGTSIQYYLAYLFDDTGGPVVYMNPETGAAITGGTPASQLAAATFQLPGSGHIVRLRRATMATAFVVDGVKLKIWAVNIVNDVLTPALPGDFVTSGFVLPGSDAGGPSIDAGAPDIPTANLKFKGDLVAKIVAGANNWESVYDVEIGFFYPAAATGNSGSPRNFFDPDTGVDTGVWETSGTTTATFGVGGNSGFFTGGRGKFIGKVAKTSLPSGALGGNIAIIARAYNKTQGTTGPVATTNPATSAGFATGTALSSLSATDTPNNGATLTAPTAKFKDGFLVRFDVDSVPQLLGEWRAAFNLDDNAGASYNFVTRAWELGAHYFDMGQSGVVHLNVRKDDIFASGRTSVRVYYKITNAVGVTGSNITTLLLADAAGPPLDPDTAVPSSLTTPILSTQPEVIKAQNMHADASNNQWITNFIVFKVVNNAGALINYINPTAAIGASIATASEATAKIDAKSGHHNLKVTAAQLASGFGGPADRNIRVYFYVKNLFGTSLASPDSLPLPFSSLGTDLLPQDTAVPSNFLTPTIFPKKESFIVKSILAQTNINTILYDELVIKIVNNAGTLIDYLDPFAVGAAVPPGGTLALREVAARQQVANGNNKLFNVRKDDLIATFGPLGGTKLVAYYYAINQRGTSNTSPGVGASADSVAVAFTALGPDGMSGDSAAPSGLVAPSIDWTAAGRLRIRGMFASTDIVTLKKKYLVIYDGTNTGSTKYLDLVNRNATTGSGNEPSARFEFGIKSHLLLSDIKKKIYSNVFGPTGNFKVYWYAENDIGISSPKSADSNTLNVANIPDVMSDDFDAVKAVDVGSLMSAPQNLVDNGDMGYATSTASNLASWRAWDKVSTISNANTTVITTSSSNLSWNQTEHHVKWDNNGSALAQRLRSLVPGDYFSLSFLFKNSGVFTFPFPTITIQIIKQGSTVNEVEATPSISTGGFTNDYIMLGAVLRFATTGSGADAHWLVIRTPDSLSGTRYFMLDRIMFVRGKQPYSFIWSPTDAAIDFSIAPNSIGASPDVGTAGGSQSGYFESGTGGGFNVQ